MATKEKKKIADDDLSLFPDHTVHVHGSDMWGDDQDEGQLAVDVYDAPEEIVLHSAIAGVNPNDLEVFVHNDMLTVRGKRAYERTEENAQYLVRECHWGGFSRSIILPSEIDADRISATLKNGVLTVRMPKVERSRKIAVRKL